MITIRSAKSKLEHADGMNHLIVQFGPIGDVTAARIGIVLPQGISRSSNLSRFYENDKGEIVIYRPDRADEFIITIYTDEPISCGSKPIVAVLIYTDKQGNEQRIEYVYRMEVALEEQMDDVLIDEEVVAKVRELRLAQRNDGERDALTDDYAAAKPIPIAPGPYSDLEKKYRIEG
ncbi:hypothetical protein [Paenibacillus harenae]|uniref:hypothetical protein n=1 Tax=Paenibacillus harenae TaxID=306543 RepID=UPI00279300EE|nr:hypothetical protein [Paenibacillus harenae]MDQ0060934.1 hypothetical protein [Paenibacillus harenae]